MPTIVTPPSTLGFAVPNSSARTISQDTTAVEISGISNVANNFDTTSAPLTLLKDGNGQNVFSRMEDGHLYSLFFFQEDTPGSNDDGAIRSWTLWKHHPSSGIVRLAISENFGDYYSNPNASVSIPNTGWTLLNNTVGTLRIKQINAYLSPLPSPTAGGVLPSSISNLKIWLKADAGVTTSTENGNTYLTSWADQSGSGQLMQTYASYGGDSRVRVYPNRINGKPAIGTTGSRTLLLLEPIANLVVGQNTTIISVHKSISDGIVYSMGEKQVFSSYPFQYRFQKMGLHGFYHSVPFTYFDQDHYVGDLLTNGYVSNSPFPRDYDKFKLTTSIARATPLSTNQLIINGKSQFLSPITFSVGNIATAYLSFGASPFYSDWNMFELYNEHSEIAEFIYFNRALTDQELANVTEGLRIKYALY